MTKQILNSHYNIDENGVVTNSKTKNVLKTQINQKGYKCINLYIKGNYKHFKLHKLIAYYFIPNPDNLPCINHLDGNKLNNDISNLEWSTLSSNTKHAYDNGLILKRFRFDKETETAIVILYNNGNSQNKIASHYKTSQQTICNIIKRNKHVGQSS